MKLSAAARVRQGSPWGCDDRTRVVDGGRLCLVADGSGPTYGGYHEPIALDPGLDLIAEAMASDRHRGHRCDEACLRDAFLRANETMWAACEAFARAFEQELAAGGDRDRVEASLRAGQRVAREHFGRAIDSHAHTAGSVTGLYIDGERAFIAQVGLCRAYRWRRGALELVLPDDGVWRKMPATDDDRYYGITGALLGVAPSPAVTTREVDCAPGDRFVLCSDGAWGVAGDGAIAAACGRQRAAEIVAAISDAATRVRDDVAIVAVVIA